MKKIDIIETCLDCFQFEMGSICTALDRDVHLDMKEGYYIPDYCPLESAYDENQGEGKDEL